MKARNPLVTKETRRQIGDLAKLGWYHSIELPSGEVIPGVQTLDQLRQRVRQFPLPEDLTGKRVLDIGAWDGWFSFECERRGASVVAVDAAQSEKFLTARELLGSKVEFLAVDVYDLRPAELGKFDIVLFLGVLYHLKHPLLALERVCALTTGLACIESFVLDNGDEPGQKPCMEFYETTELCGQFDNWVGPNTACLMSFCRTAGFARVSLESVIDNRAHLTCYRQWDTSPNTADQPRIVSVENAVSRDLGFSAAKDDYVAIWFKAGQAELSENEVYPEIGPYGARPALLQNVGGDGWQAIVKLPPGLDAGWTPVKLRVRQSAFSNTVRIGVDVKEEDRSERMQPTTGGEETRIEIVADGKTWERNKVRMGCLSPSISLWVRGLEPGYRPSDVWVRLAGHDLPSVFVSQPDPMGLTQVNALLPAGLPPQVTEVSLAIDNRATPPVPVEILPA